MNLCQSIFVIGHTLCTDNWYTSINLAQQFLERYTHLMSTLRINRKGNPKDVLDKKAKLGKCFAEESREGITILKWKEKRDGIITFH